MADYYSLLAKAVAKLTDATPEARQEVYERARKALAGQLRNLDPPVPAEAIEREAQALEIAVAQVEMDIAASASSRTGLTADETDFYGIRSAGAPASLDPNGREPAPHERSVQDSKSQAGIKPSRRTESPQNPPLAQPLKVRRKASEKRPKEPAEINDLGAGETGTGGTASGRNSEPSNPEPAAATDIAGLGEPATGPGNGNGPPIMTASGLNSFAPDSQHDQGRIKRLIAVVGIVGLIVISIAVAAYRLRDRPEDLMRLQPQRLQGEAASGGKIADRVDKGAGVERPPPPSEGLSDAERKVTAPAVAPLPVAHRAALLVEAKDETNKVNTYVGRVIWRAENVSSGPDEPLRTAVRAEIEIPEVKFQASVIIQKNFDRTLSASHTVKLAFSVGDGSPLGNIRQISALQMRQEDTPVGDSLEGITVPIMDNSFLIGLARGAAEASNLERLQTREWLDVPMVLASGLSAKLTLEKGPSGQRIFDAAIASWRAQ
jgi:hypothetical protein